MLYPVSSLLRHLQISQWLSCPVARSSNRLTIPMCALWCHFFFHSLHRTVFAGKSIDYTLVRKYLLDFRCAVAGVWANRECVSCFICLVLSTLAHTFFLLSGRAISDSRYNSFTFVGFRHTVIQRHAWFSSGSSRFACVDLFHTGVSVQC